MTDNVLIKYSIDQIFACREANAVMPTELIDYCNNMDKNNMSVLTDLVKHMDDVTKSHSHGVNPNDITLRTTIREGLNKLNNKNYDTVLKEFEALNYSNETHFSLLASELIIKSMNDVMATKGFEVSKNVQKTPSELYMDIALRFSKYGIQVEDETETLKRVIKFIDVMSTHCQNYFITLTDKSESMDKNNPHKVNNYKGFMNMIGLMYSNGMFPAKIVMQCFNKIITLILDEGLPQEDCDNYYSGYERLMNRILSHFEKEVTPNTIRDFNNIKGQLKAVNDKITLACENSPKPPIRMFSTMTHKQNINRLKSLCETYEN